MQDSKSSLKIAHTALFSKYSWIHVHWLIGSCSSSCSSLSCIFVHLFVWIFLLLHSFLFHKNCKSSSTLAWHFCYFKCFFFLCFTCLVFAIGCTSIWFPSPLINTILCVSGYWNLHKPFQCQQCNASFCRKPYLDIHMVKFENNRQSNSKSNLKIDHNKIHIIF